MNSWQPRANYACGFFSDTHLKIKKSGVTTCLHVKQKVSSLDTILNRAVNVTKKMHPVYRNRFPRGQSGQDSAHFDVFHTRFNQNTRAALHSTSAFLAIHPPSSPSPVDNGELRTSWAGQPL